jgi:phosphonatase-like hydrolase
VTAQETRPALVIFDLAGTTVEDRGQVPEAFAAALAEQGVVVSPDTLAGVRGASKRQSIERLVPDGPGRGARAEAAFTSFQRHLAERYAAGVRPVQGAEDAFRWLKTLQIRVALNTGFDRATTALLLAALGWDHGVADAVVCGDDVSEGRPAPYLIFRAMEATGTHGVDRVASVGDTLLDLEAGRNAGVRWNIGVLSGAHGRDRLEQAPHTHLVEHVGLLRRLFEG